MEYIEVEVGCWGFGFPFWNDKKTDFDFEKNISEANTA
jgi:hypothetical protein